MAAPGGGDLPLIPVQDPFKREREEKDNANADCDWYRKQKTHLDKEIANATKKLSDLATELMDTTADRVRAVSLAHITNNELAEFIQPFRDSQEESQVFGNQIVATDLLMQAFVSELGRDLGYAALKNRTMDTNRVEFINQTRLAAKGKSPKIPTKDEITANITNIYAVGNEAVQLLKAEKEKAKRLVEAIESMEARYADHTDSCVKTVKAWMQIVPLMAKNNMMTNDMDDYKKESERTKVQMDLIKADSQRWTAMSKYYKERIDAECEEIKSSKRQA